jgi:8-oxo-dGTP pyrophosphatase MutT (NUDIX family)
VEITSIKGVLFDLQGRVLLCHNERGDWELPGGRPYREEDDETCLRREIREETGLEVEVAELLTTYRFDVLPGREVAIRAYGCRLSSRVSPLVLSDEHTDLAFVASEALQTIDLPSGYRDAIALGRARALPT